MSMQLGAKLEQFPSKSKGDRNKTHPIQPIPDMYDNNGLKYILYLLKTLLLTKNLVT